MLLMKQKVYWLLFKQQTEKNYRWLFIWKNASSNHLVDKIKSIVAFKMSKLYQEESVFSNSLQSILLAVLRREDRLLL